MVKADPIDATAYELPLGKAPAVGREPPPPPGRTGRSLPEPMLVENAMWFCHLRSGVIATLLAIGALGFLPGRLGALIWRLLSFWPFVTAAVLAVSNTCYLLHLRSLKSAEATGRARSNLWAQIILDLVLLTAVVHFVGSMTTHVAFAYLFHIVLACIFFSLRQSLLVALTASFLYAACVSAERVGILPPAGLFPSVSPQGAIGAEPLVFTINLVSAISIWLVVWYLSSHLSRLVRVRDVALAQTNDRLAASLAERSRHMLTTTHQLKSPFAAIHANTQLLLGGYCGELPDKAVDVAQRIAARCRRLATEIQEMLQLANLESTSQGPPAWQDLDLAELLRGAVGQIEPTAQERDITIRTDLRPARARGVEDHLKMLFINLVSNAVNYSHAGGTVHVRCATDSDGAPVASIADEGIGIPAEKLPRIFDEHFRTNEAVRHNKQSSGLGLAIVKRVAAFHRIRLWVRSKPGEGTTFQLQFHRPGEGTPDGQEGES